MFHLLYSYGNDTNSMLLEDVDCSSSNYLVLLQCSYRSRYSFYCNDHDRDAFVVCCKYIPYTILLCKYLCH